MKRTAWIFPALLIALAIGYFLGRGGESSGPGVAHEIAAVWTCSMHPQIQSPDPGDCPLCGMDLIESTTTTGASAESIQLTAREQQLAAVETSRVVRRAVERELRLFGTLSVPESSERTVTARVEGRIEAVHVDQVGIEVRKDVALVEFYSPDLYAAQQEYLESRSRGGALADAARERLIAWGLSEDQIARLAERGIAKDVVTLRAPVSGVVLKRDAVEGRWVGIGALLYRIAPLDLLWLKLEVYESELAGVREGLRVDFRLEAFPGEEFTGEVDFLGRVVDPVTHSVFARVVVENRDHRLRPGMFARAHLHVPVSDNAMVIPVTAPLITGERAVVYVEHPSHPGEYSGRVIMLGPRAGDSYVVLNGLSEGELVVTRGAFRLDSSLQIKGMESMMSAPEPGGAQ